MSSSVGRTHEIVILEVLTPIPSTKNFKIKMVPVTKQSVHSVWLQSTPHKATSAQPGPNCWLRLRPSLHRCHRSNTTQSHTWAKGVWGVSLNQPIEQLHFSTLVIDLVFKSLFFQMSYPYCYLISQHDWHFEPGSYLCSAALLITEVFLASTLCQ